MTIIHRSFGILALLLLMSLIRESASGFQPSVSRPGSSTHPAGAPPASNHRNNPRRRLPAASDADSSLFNENTRKQKQKLNRNFIQIAFPAFLQQASTPLADLISSTFLGRLSPSELGGVGVARSSQAAVSKLYTTPLAKTTISLVASKYGAASSDSESTENTELISAVSTSLWLALIVGVLQLFVFSVFATNIITYMGISPSSEMAPSATSFMKARALAAPAAAFWLVLNGIFRGLGDTVSPLKCSILLNAVNWILAPIFIFTLKFGASGAAFSLAIAQYTAPIPLTLMLRKRVQFRLFRGKWVELRKTLKQYARACVYLLGQTIARVATFTYFSRQSALLGSVGASAYSILFQIGFVITMVCESISVSTQTLLSREFANNNTSSTDDDRRMICTHLIQTSLAYGGLTALFLSCMVYLFRSSVIALFAKNADVQLAAMQALPAFLMTQVVKGLAFSSNGILMGGMDWRTSMITMWLANVVSISTFRMTAGPTTVTKLWHAWTVFLSTQAICGMARYISRTGVWKQLKRTKTKA